MKATALRKVAVAGVAFLGAAALVAAGATAATADPSSSGRTYTAVGSDTIQDLYNGFGNGYTTTANGAVNPGQSIASWDAFGAGGAQNTQITIGGQQFYRPAGSGDGVKALSAAWNTTHTYTDAAGHSNTVAANSIQIARSSGRPGTPVLATDPNNKLSFVPLARDAVSVAIQTAGLPAGTVAPTNFTTNDLKFIYGGTGTPDANITQSGTASPVYHADASHSFTLNVKLPQSGSGTRSFFLGAIGVTAPASWVTSTIAENHADAINTSGDIAPFSAAQWIAQKNGLSSTFTGTNAASLKITKINSVEAVTASNTPGALYGSLTAAPAGGAGNFNRDVYSVVPTANNTGATNTLVQTTLRNASYIGAVDHISHNVVEDFGFLKISYTGTTGYLYSNWTN